MASLVGILLLLTACSGSAAPTIDDSASAASVEAEPSPTPAPATPEPTAAATPSPPTDVQPTDEERVAVAIAAHDAADLPLGTVADLIKTTVTGEAVELTHCVWDGESVYDTVVDTAYQVTQDANGELQAQRLFDSPTADECLNSELLDTALQATRDYDAFWSGVLEDPTSFDPIAAAAIMESRHQERSQVLVAEWVAAGTYWQGASFDAALPDSSVVPIAYRRYEFEDLSVLDVVGCRDMDPTFGLYRTGGLLVTDDKTMEQPGPHSVDIYSLIRENGRWFVGAVRARVWADCLTNPWPEAMDQSFPDPTTWSAVE